MTPPRIICVGHAALDRIYRIQAFPPTQTKVRALEHVESGGGMAANAAVAIARLGGKAELWSRVGDDAAGQTIRDGLKANRVDQRYVQAFEGARSSTSAILVDGHGHRLIVGDRDTGMPGETSWLPLERIAEAAVVLGDLRWLEGVRAAFTEARRAGVPTILDADLGARDALSDILPVTDYAVFAQPALDDFLSQGTRAEKLAKVLAFGPRYAGVTMGEQGYVWQEAGGAQGAQPAFAVEVVDTTGAGDAFHGAFALAVAQRRPAADCARRAAAVAALKCQRLGSRAGLPDVRTLDAFLAQHDLRSQSPP